MAPSRLVRPPVLVAATALQVTGLVAWLGLAGAYPAGSSPALLGVAALAAGLFLGSHLTGAVVRGVRRRPPLRRTLALGVSEAVLWVGWLAVAGLVGGPGGVLAASAVLAVTLLPHRALETGSLRPGSPTVEVSDPVVALAAGVEAAGAAAWLALARHGPLVGDALGVGVPTWGDLASVAGVRAAAVAPADSAGTAALVGVVALSVLRLAGRLLVVRHAGRGDDRRATRTGGRTVAPRPPRRW